MTPDDIKTTQPWSAEAEQAVLASVMLDAEAYERAQPLQAGQFHHAAHRRIWEALGQLVAAHEPTDVLSVMGRMGRAAEQIGGLNYLHAVSVSVPSSRNVRRYADIVREHATRRDLIEAADEALEAARSGEPVPEILERIGSLMAGLQRQQSRKAPRRLGEIVAQRTEHYQALQDGAAVAGWPTHMPTLDRALAGGLRPGKLYFIGARPAVGKSSFSAQLLLTLASDGHPGLMLSQEMAGEEVADRAVANRGRIEYGRLQSGQLDDEDWCRAVEMLEGMRDLPVWVDDQGALTLADIRSKVRSIPGLQVLVLDYLQLCSRSSTSSASNRNSEIEEISRGLKALAMELGLAVICLSQLNRQVEQRAGQRPVLADLRDSGSIEQDADAVLMLWPGRDAGDGCKLVGLGIAKNRQGRCMDMVLNFRGAVQRWEESTESLHDSADEQAPRRRGFSA